MRARRTLAISLVTLLAFAVPTACSSDDGKAADGPTTTAPAPTTAPPTAAPTTAPPTAAPTTVPPAVFATPSAAGDALFRAWTSGDRAAAGALGLAPATELDKLFGSPPGPSVKNRGCDDGDFDAASCFFGNGQGGVNVALAPATGGWSIVTVDPFG